MNYMTLEQAEEAKHSGVWKNVCTEIDFRVAALLNEFKNCSEERVSSLQSQIRELEKLKTLPQDVIDRETTPL